mmetsp:Transcript_3887/g.9105  ORF Transcript_3887/g.9105 Transcript_3887/m.9105 type:complete len:329 (+) Transcript_3887:1254-2240(+)
MSTPRHVAPTPPGPTRSLPTPTASSPPCSAPSSSKRLPPLRRSRPLHRTMFPSTAPISTRRPTKRSPSALTSTTRSPMRATALPRPVPPLTRPLTPSSVLIRPAARLPVILWRGATPSTSAGRILTFRASRRVIGRIVVALRPLRVPSSPSTSLAMCTPRPAVPKNSGPTMFSSMAMVSSLGFGVPLRLRRSRHLVLAMKALVFAQASSPLTAPIPSAMSVESGPAEVRTVPPPAFVPALFGRRPAPTASQAVRSMPLRPSNSSSAPSTTNSSSLVGPKLECAMDRTSVELLARLLWRMGLSVRSAISPAMAVQSSVVSPASSRPDGR